MTRRVSVSSAGAQADQSSSQPAISANGRFVAFVSVAANLVPGDTNGVGDVFVHDLLTSTTRRVSLATGGFQAETGASTGPALSGDGRYVAFDSGASDLVPNDTNEASDAFVRDRRSGTTRRVNVGPGGIQSNGQVGGRVAISADGRLVAFNSNATNLVPGDTNGTYDVFIHDRDTDTTRRVSVGPGGVQGNGFSFPPTLSADGHFVAFPSDATNLVRRDTNGSLDVFVRNLKQGTTQRGSVGPGGVQADDASIDPTISAHGQFVAFVSNATNLVRRDTNGAADVFVRIFAPDEGPDR